MADFDQHLVDIDPNAGYLRVAKDVFAGTCGGIGKLLLPYPIWMNLALFSQVCLGR
jgi:hypothetical protein